MVPPEEESGRLRVEFLASRHLRNGFSCGHPVVDDYLRTRARQDAERGVANPFVVTQSAGRVVGYYTLSQTGVDLSSLPPVGRRRLPRYPLVPATLIGRLAVDQDHQGRGLGEFLLMDALDRSRRASRQVASFAVIVEAQDARARDFSVHYGFQPFPEEQLKLFIPMESLDRLAPPRRGRAPGAVRPRSPCPITPTTAAMLRLQPCSGEQGRLIHIPQDLDVQLSHQSRAAIRFRSPFPCRVM